MDKHNTYFDLTVAERKALAKLTLTEQVKVDNFVAAAKALPRSISIRVNDDGDGEPNLIVSKRITQGSTMMVASLRKKSLVF